MAVVLGLGHRGLAVPACAIPFWLNSLALQGVVDFARDVRVLFRTVIRRGGRSLIFATVVFLYRNIRGSRRGRASGAVRIFLQAFSLWKNISTGQIRRDQITGGRYPFPGFNI